MQGNLRAANLRPKSQEQIEQTKMQKNESNFTSTLHQANTLHYSILCRNIASVKRTTQFTKLTKIRKNLKPNAFWCDAY